MKHLYTDVHIASPTWEFLSLAADCFCKLAAHDTASLFIVKQGTVYFSCKNSHPIKVEVGELFCTTTNADIVISTGEDTKGLREQGSLCEVHYQTDERADLCRPQDAVFFHTCVPSVVNPLPGILPIFTYMSREDIRGIQGLDGLMALFQDSGLVQENARELVRKRIAETIAIVVNEFALERLESEMAVEKDGFHNRRMLRVLQAIHQHPEAAWTLESLAAQANLSRSAFAKEFKSVSGTTPRHYVTRIRMERAADELRNGHKPISQVAEEAGYNSEAAFNKAFLKIIGDTPGHYRRG